MSTQITGFLDSYDLFGKAIPGIAWFFGIFLIAPSSLQSSISGNTIEFRGLAALLVLSIIGGLIFGQGIDILARLFEQLLAWIRHKFRGLGQISTVVYGKMSIKVRSSIYPEITERANSHPEKVFAGINTIGVFGILTLLSNASPIDLSITLKIAALVVFLLSAIYISWYWLDMANFFRQIELLEDFDRSDPSKKITDVFRWALNQFSAFNTAVTSHRSLFMTYLDARAEAYVYPNDLDNIAYSRFESVIEPYLDVTLEKYGRGEKYSFVDLYPFVTSNLQANELNRAQGFQARYSFCRSMWLTTSMFSVVLLGLYFQHTQSQPLSDTFGTPPDILALVFYVFWAVVLGIGIARIFEGALRLVGQYSSTIAWIYGSSFSLLFVSHDSGGDLARWSSHVLWESMIIVLSAIRKLAEEIATLCQYAFGYETYSQVVTIQIFGDATLGLAVLLGISAVAFFNATGSYKRNYVEYLIAETWISLSDSVGSDTDGPSETDDSGDDPEGSDSGGSEREADSSETGGPVTDDLEDISSEISEKRK